jgi:hypothetical protein
MKFDVFVKIYSEKKFDEFFYKKVYKNLMKRKIYLGSLEKNLFRKKVREV